MLGKLQLQQMHSSSDWSLKLVLEATTGVPLKGLKPRLFTVDLLVPLKGFRGWYKAGEELL